MVKGAYKHYRSRGYTKLEAFVTVTPEWMMCLGFMFGGIIIGWWL